MQPFPLPLPPGLCNQRHGSCILLPSNDVEAHGFLHPPPYHPLPPTSLGLNFFCVHCRCVIVGFGFPVPIHIRMKWRIPLSAVRYYQLERWDSFVGSRATDYLVAQYEAMIGCSWPHSTFWDSASQIGFSRSKRKISVVLVREQTIPTERPPLVGELSANFLRIEGSTWSALRIPTAVFSVF
jgi:hypothetical protein